ncbi:MAG: LD-carboxypeptidase [Deltaproteobacteria bacterium]|nr:LD-carboxypeptidase [Deltaproteobacteria bacterium]
MKQNRLPIMPPLLSPGDCVAIVAPASHIPTANKGYLEQGAERLRAMGFEVIYAPSLLKRKHLYLAGEDQERAEELTAMFLDHEVKAILCARGGYGCQRIIPYLDPDLIRTHPKPLVGCSDITVLLIYLLHQCHLIPFHGPNVASQQFVEGNAEMAQALKMVLTSPVPIAQITCSVLKEGDAEGEIIGGCLSSLVTTVATPYEPDLGQKILFVEDVNEPPYKIDRMLTHLKSAGKLTGIKGVIFGQMPGCDTEQGLLHEVIHDVLKEVEGPILFNFPSGHGPHNLTIPLGVPIRIHEGTVTFHKEVKNG